IRTYFFGPAVRRRKAPKQLNFFASRSFVQLSLDANGCGCVFTMAVQRSLIRSAATDSLLGVDRVCEYGLTRPVRRKNRTEESAMNWDQVEGKWKQYKGQIKQKWGKLTDDDLDVIEGRRNILVGKIQEYYGTSKEISEKEADEFVKNLKAEERQQEKAQRAGRARETGPRFRR